MYGMIGNIPEIMYIKDFIDDPVLSSRPRLGRHYKSDVRTKPKIGRNDVCHCGSGVKYKKCCLVQDNKLSIT